MAGRRGPRTPSGVLGRCGRGRLWAGAFAPAWAGPNRPGLAAFGRPEPPPAAVPVLQRPLEDGHAAPPYPVPASPQPAGTWFPQAGGQNLSWTSTLLYDNILICLIKANNLIASVWCPSQWKGEKGRRLKAAAAPATVRAGAYLPDLNLRCLYAPFSAAALINSQSLAVKAGREGAAEKSLSQETCLLTRFACCQAPWGTKHFLGGRKAVNSHI